MQVGALVLENTSGKILGFIGGVDYKTQQLNHATRTYRSPGSTIKPILVYGPAMDKGYITPSSSVLDKRFNYNGWKPENFAKTEYGVIPAKQALAMSLNLSTIRLYSAFVGENPVENYMEKMNFRNLTQGDKENLSAAIGGFANGISVMENTSAFATFANMGTYKKPHIIEEIRDNNNEVIYKADTNGVQVYTKETSYMMLNMLNGVLNASYGTAKDIASGLNFSTKNLFLKTGTAEYNNDLWVVGGSSNITLGLWTGYDRPTPMNDYYYAHKEWTTVMNAIYAYNKNLVAPDKEFTRPNTVINSNINPTNNGKGSISDMVPNNFKELDNFKMLRKFGSMIDKNITFNLNPVETKKKEEDKEKEKETSQSDATPNVDAKEEEVYEYEFE